MNLSQRFSPHLRRQWHLAVARRAKVPLPAAELAALQLSALKQTWSEATTHIPYYRSLVDTATAPARIETWDDLRAIPVLTRRILQERSHEFVRRSGPPQSIMKTAGSTGQPLRIGMNQAERDLMRVVKLAEWQSFGYTPSSRLFLIWGHGHLLGTGWSGRLNHVRRKFTDAYLGYQRVDAYRLNRPACEAFAEALLKFRPLGLISYGSALDLFARYTEAFRERFRALGLRFVLSTAEAPPRDDTVPRLEDLFGCPVVQEYGGAEFGQVAFNRGLGSFEVYGDLNYVEGEAPEADDASAAPLLVTTLYSRYLPLVRYRVGDAVRRASRLPNGHVREFAEVAGRVNDVIELAAGEFIHSVAVFHCIHQEPSVFGIQMVLLDQGIEINLVADVDGRAEAQERVRRRLAQVHPLLAHSRFRYVEDLEATSAGKRRWFVDRRSAPCVA